MRLDEVHGLCSDVMAHSSAEGEGRLGGRRGRGRGRGNERGTERGRDRERLRDVEIISACTVRT